MTTTTARAPAIRWGTAVVALVTGAVAATGPAAAAQDRDGARDRDRPTLRAVELLVAEGAPGVTVHATDTNGVWKTAIGVGDLRTGKKRGENDRFRAASVTKTFVATVLLQMEAEGKLDLDDTVERWLPDLVRGHGHDGRKITIRRLLNHTAGIYDYTDDPGFRRTYVHEGFQKHRYDTLRPTEIVRIAMAHPPNFEPGTAFRYSNTGYVLAGMIIDRVSGTSYEDEVRDRIIEPLGLRGTTAPGDRVRLPKPSGRAYSKLSPHPNATEIHDVTELNPSQGRAMGDIVSTAADLDRFMGALMRGELLPPEQLAAMRTTTPGGYGLGIQRVPTRCGAAVWGHGGIGPGTLSYAMTTEDGRHRVALNLNGDWSLTRQTFGRVADAEFCGIDPGAPSKATAKDAEPDALPSLPTLPSPNGTDPR
ncbi:serine hydrolase domain-containing protein [Streptomyces sp. NPDC058953]|uniref:serine hydrolase domain-containing protein n=1 Tax=unclassified Streptomyces TaxID=2593676 RepID=UPI0036C6CDB2